MAHVSYREIERVFATLMLDDFREPLYIDRQKYTISLMIYLQEYPPKQEMNKLRILFIKAMRSENKTAIKVGFESFKMLLEFSDFQYKLPEELFNYWIFDAEEEDEDISLLAVSILDDDYYSMSVNVVFLKEHPNWNIMKSENKCSMSLRPRKNGRRQIISDSQRA